MLVSYGGLGIVKSKETGNEGKEMVAVECSRVEQQTRRPGHGSCNIRKWSRVPQLGGDGNVEDAKGISGSCDSVGWACLSLPCLLLTQVGVDREGGISSRGARWKVLGNQLPTSGALFCLGMGAGGLDACASEPRQFCSAVIRVRQSKHTSLQAANLGDPCSNPPILALTLTIDYRTTIFKATRLALSRQLDLFGRLGCCSWLAIRLAV